MGVVNWIVAQIRENWASYLVAFQVSLNVTAIGLIFLMSVYRKGAIRKNKEIMPVLHERVTDICCGENLNIADLKGLKPRHRIVVRGLILKALGSVSGTYRDNLVKLYKDMNFLNEDREALRSSSFAKRLSALSRIEVIQDMESGAMIGKLLHDPSPYVHFAALKFLLKVRFPKLHVNIQREMNLMVSLERMDTAQQILEMYAKNYTEDFLSLLKSHQRPEVINICLDVVFRLQIIDALPIIKERLIDGLRCEGYPEFADFDFRRYTLCLTMAPDEEIEEVLQKMTKTDVPTVRNVAYLALFKIRPDLMPELTVRLSQDDSPQGRRLYNQMLDAQMGRAA